MSTHEYEQAGPNGIFGMDTYPRRRDGFRPEPNSGFGIGVARYRPASAQPVPYQERIHDQEG
jgi:hypothetical protein